MRKKGYIEDANISDTGNWNVASDYSKLKIMQHLYMADEYEIIATFGTSTLIEEMQLTFNPDYLRIRAFRRLVKALIMLIDNSLFAIKDVRSQFGRKQKANENDKTKTDKDILIEYRKDLKQVYDIIPALFKVKRDSIRKTSEVSINKELYDPVLEKVLAIKSKINEPLNRSDLLFLDKEEFDPRDFKKQIMERLATKG